MQFIAEERGYHESMFCTETNDSIKATDGFLKAYFYISILYIYEQIEIGLVGSMPRVQMFCQKHISDIKHIWWINSLFYNHNLFPEINVIPVGKQSLIRSYGLL